MAGWRLSKWKESFSARQRLLAISPRDVAPGASFPGSPARLGAIAVFARPATPALARCNRGLSTAERLVAEAVSLSCGGGMRPDLRPAAAVSPRRRSAFPTRALTARRLVGQAYAHARRRSCSTRFAFQRRLQADRIILLDYWITFMRRL